MTNIMRQIIVWIWAGVHRTWARGIVTEYTYTNAGELDTINYSDATPDVDFDYDRRGRPSQVIDGIGTQTMDYTAPGQLTGHHYTSGLLTGISITSSYDTLFRRTSLDSGTGVPPVHFAYDAASRLSVVSNGVHTATYNYHLNSGLVSNIVFATGGTVKMTTTKTYDNLNRLRSIASVSSVVSSHTYDYNPANQRTRVTLADGSYWEYQYDALGQVTSGKKYWPDNTEVAGQQFGYDFDDIGNRKTTAGGGSGATSTYSANLLNQYTQRTVPGAVDILGTAQADATVTVNNMPTQRKGEYFYKDLSVPNTVSAQYPEISIVGVRKNAGPDGADVVTEETGHVFVPKTPEVFQHDADGNLTSDGRWTYTWDAENRLVGVETAVSAVTAGAPEQKLEFSYDFQSRRISKKVYEWNGASGEWQVAGDLWFVYDGWNLVVELDATLAPVRTHTWGLDLSGSEQGAGGVGGLLFTTTHAPAASTRFVSFDGNGNVSALLNVESGVTSAEYEYDPFGNTLRATGPAAEANPFRFSTKYLDAETGLYYYGYRYYQPSTGRWLSRDPMQEQAALNLFLFAGNAAQGKVDTLGNVDYDVDSQGFHVRLRRKLTFKVEFDQNGNWEIQEKPGHPLTASDKKEAQAAFEKLIKDPKQQEKMKQAVARRFPNFRNQNFVRNIGRGLRRACGVAAVGIAAYQVATSDKPVKAAGGLVLEAGASVPVGAAGIYLTGGTVTATGSGLMASTGVGALIIGTATVGYAIGDGISGINVGEQSIAEHIADFILWSFTDIDPGKF